MKVTKEKLAELIKLANTLHNELNNIEEYNLSEDAEHIVDSLIRKLDRMCGKEYLESLNTK